MKYILSILFLIFVVLAVCTVRVAANFPIPNNRDTIPTGVPQLFGGKYYKFNGYVLADSLLMTKAADTVGPVYFPALKFKLSDGRWYGYDLNRWQKLLWPGDTVSLSNRINAGWRTDGNSGTDISTNFLGTTDNVPLAFRTNNTERIRITEGGDIGINTQTPGTTLHVEGTLAVTLDAGIPNSIAGRSGFGGISTLVHDYGLIIADGVIKVDTTDIATQYDLTQATPVLPDGRFGFGDPNNRLGSGTDSVFYDRADRTIKLTKGTSDSAAVTIQQGPFTGEKPFFRVRPPIIGDSTVDFTFTSSLNPNDNGTRSNHVVKMGGNIFNGKPAFPGMWDAWETNWFNGGANYVERHYEIRHPLTLEQSRLFSSTAILRDSLGNSSNQWDFRGNMVFSTVHNLGYGAIAPDGLDGCMLQVNTPDATHGIQFHKASGTPNEFYAEKFGSSPASLNFRGFSAYNFGTGSGASAFANAGTQLGVGTLTPNAGDRLHVYNDAGNSNIRIEATQSANGAQLLFKNDVGLVDLVYAGSTNPFQNLKDHLSVYDGTLGNPIFSINILTGNSVFERRPNLDVIDDPRLLAVLGTFYVGDTMYLNSPPDGNSTDSMLVWRNIDSTVRKIAASSIATSGTYTPTLTGVTNVAAVTLLQAQYERVGNKVTVYIKLTIDPTAAAITEVGISLPVASAIAADDIIGNANCKAVAAQTAVIESDTGNARANFYFTATDLAVQTFHGSFSYIITLP